MAAATLCAWLGHALGDPAPRAGGARDSGTPSPVSEGRSTPPPSPVGAVASAPSGTAVQDCVRATNANPRSTPLRPQAWDTLSPEV